MSNWVSTGASGHLRGRRNLDTEPELLLRKALHALGVRFRLHKRLDKGCTPDILLASRRIAVFVDGDYWHSCPLHGRKVPFAGPNATLWQAKMERIKVRDARATDIATSQGWAVVRVWECVIRRDPHLAALSVLDSCSPPPVAK